MGMLRIMVAFAHAHPGSSREEMATGQLLSTLAEFPMAIFISGPVLTHS